MKFLNIFIYLPFLLLFFNYDYFLIFALILVLLIYLELVEVKLSKYFLKYVVLFYFFLRFISAFDSRFNLLWRYMSQKNYSLNGKFIDIQSVFWNLNCNSQTTGEFIVFGTEQSLGCPYTASYGPFFEFVGFKNNPPILSFIFVFIVFILLYLYFHHEIKSLDLKNSYIFTLIFLSPPMNFLIERMNLDIFIFIVVYFLYSKVDNVLIRNFFIFLLATMKYYPIFLLLGSILFKVINRKFNNLKSDIFFFFSFLIFYVTLRQNFQIDSPVRPFRPDRTFGLLSESLNIQNALKFDLINIYMFFLIFLIFLIFLFKNQNSFTNLFQIEIVHNLLFLFILLSFFANYDYRLGFLVIVTPYLIKQKNRILFYSFIIFIFSSPGLMHAYSKLFQLVESYSFVYIDIPFYFFLAQLISEYLKYISKNLTK